ncbi:hypothetical protein AWC11_19535 [Mycobacterium interjectum]|nr:hypothetical protein AWC11_19535 [Mycobacterium interjectum]
MVTGLGVPGFVTAGSCPGQGGSAVFGSDVGATSTETHFFGVSALFQGPGGFGAAASEPSG